MLTATRGAPKNVASLFFVFEAQKEVSTTAAGTIDKEPLSER